MKKEFLKSFALSFGIAACGGDTMTNNYYPNSPGETMEQNPIEQPQYQPKEELTCDMGVERLVAACCAIPEYYDLVCTPQVTLDFLKSYHKEQCEAIDPIANTNHILGLQCFISFCEGTNKVEFPNFSSDEECSRLYKNI